MKIFTEKHKRDAGFIIALSVYILAFVFSSKVKQGVLDAVDICLGSIIPSLFPMLVLSTFLTLTGIPEKLKRLIFFPVGKITGLSADAAESFIFGATAGYPVGVKTAYYLYRKKRIGLKQAGKAALININPGLAFSVIVTGKIMFGSALTGLTLYISVTAANLLLGFLLRDKKTDISAKNKKAAPRQDISHNLIDAVSSSVKSMASICAWITVFSAFTAPLTDILKTPYINILLEVTSGTKLCAEKGFLPLCAFTMGFGGACVLFQLLPEIKELGIPIKKYLLCRLFSGIAAFITETLLINAFPVQRAVFSEESGIINLRGASLSGSTALIILCAVFMFSVYGFSDQKRAN